MVINNLVQLDTLKEMAENMTFKVQLNLLVTILLFGCNQSPKSDHDNSKPNILFIVSEDNGPELGCYGTEVATPHLDSLSNQGIRYENAYVPQAGCSPSRAAFLTGLYPHQNGQIGLATWKYAMYNDSIPNMVNDLKENGYNTGIIGKLHVNPESAFEYEWKGFSGANFQRNDLGIYAREAAAFFNEGDKPFFLQINYPDAHRPFVAQIEGMPANPLKASDVNPLPYLGLSSPKLKEVTANYLNCMMRLDIMVGDLLNALDKSGKRENTLIVYIGDHGADILRGKRTCYEGGLKIPMIISWPGKVSEKLVSEDLVSTLDLYPTFLEVIGKETPEYLPGKSLFPTFKNQPLNRDVLATEYHVHSNHNPYPQRSIRNKQFKLIYNLVPVENPGVEFTLTKFDFGDIKETIQQADPKVRDAYKRMNKPPEYELYDLQADPFEWNDLSDDSTYIEILQSLKQELRQWQINTRDPLVNKELADLLFTQIMNTNREKVEIPYSEYMDPN